MSKKRGSQGDWERGSEYMDEFVSPPDAERMNTLPPGQVQRAPLRPLSIVDPRTTSAQEDAAQEGGFTTSGQERAGAPRWTLDPSHRPNTGGGAGGQGSFSIHNTGFLGGNGTVSESRTAAGDPLFIPTTAVPLFELRQSLDGVRAERDGLDKFVSGAGDQFKGKAADQYQPGYEQYVAQEQQRFVDDVANTYYDGNTNAAWTAIYKDPELRAQWDRNNRYLAAIGTANREGWDRYAKIAEARDKGLLYLDPKTNEAVEGMLDGTRIWGTDSPAESAYNIDNLDSRLSLTNYFNTFIKGRVPQGGDINQDEGEVITKNGRKFIRQTREKDYDEFAESTVSELADQYPEFSEDELREFVEAKVPRESVTTLRPLPIGGSGGSGGGSGSGGASMNIVANENIPYTVSGKQANYAHYEVKRPTSLNYGDNDTRVAMTFGNVTGTSGRPLAAGNFSTKSGASSYMVPSGVFLGSNGSLMLYGKGVTSKGDRWNSPKNSGIAADIAAIEKLSRGEAMTPEEEGRYMTMPDIVIPYRGNEGALKALMPTRTDELDYDKLRNTLKAEYDRVYGKAPASAPAKEPAKADKSTKHEHLNNMTW